MCKKLLVLTKAAEGLVSVSNTVKNVIIVDLINLL